MSLYHRRRDRTGPIWPIQMGHNPTDRPDLWEVVEIDDAAIKPRQTLMQVLEEWEFGGRVPSYGHGAAHLYDLASRIRRAFPEAGL